MNARRMRFLAVAVARSMSNRPTRVLLLISALTITASLATALVAVSQGVEARLGESLRAFGANIVVESAANEVGVGSVTLGETGARLDPDEYVSALGSVPGVESVQPRVRITVVRGTEDLLVLGIGDAEMSEAKWRLTGALPREGEALVGVDVASKHKVAVGSAVPGFPGMSVSGVIESGSEHDQAVVLTMPDALALTQGRVTQFLVRADSASVDEAANTIAEEFPALSARTVRQVADAERLLLDKVRRLLLIVTICVSFVSAIAVGNTQSIVVMERTEEIGLLKAMGAMRSFILGYFALEGTVLTLAAGVLGLVTGVAVAEAIATSVFRAAVPIPLLAWPAPFLVAGTVSVIAGTLPVWRASATDASNTLKGL